MLKILTAWQDISLIVHVVKCDARATIIMGYSGASNADAAPPSELELLLEPPEPLNSVVPL